jgi:TRAP-type C4-dicarboxylate transport system substrate-binding protein
MRKLQKFSFPVLIGIFLLILAACGGDDESVTTTSTGSTGGSTTAATTVPGATDVPDSGATTENTSEVTTTGESFEFQYVCVNRTLLPCQVIQEYMDNVNTRTDGQIEIQLSSYPELGISGFDMIRLLEDGTIGLGEIYSGFVGGEFPIFEAANLWGTFNTLDQWFDAADAVEDEIKALVKRETDGGQVVGFNYYPSQYFFTKKPLNTLPDFEGVKTRSHSTVLSDLISTLGANPQTMAFADVYPALERGVLDGAVTCGSCGIGQKWSEVTDNLTGPIPGSWAQTFVTFNGTEWRSLPEDFQAILLDEGVLHTARAKASSLASDDASEGTLVELGMTHALFTDEMLTILKDAAQSSVVPKWAERAGGFESEAVQIYNDKIAPIVGLYVLADGTVEKR